MPKIKQKHLKALIKERCYKDEEIDDEIDDLLEGLDASQYIFKDNKEWKAISVKFQFARSFSFFRVTDEVDEKNMEDEVDEKNEERGDDN